MNDLEMTKLCAEAMGLDIKDGSLSSEVYGAAYFVMADGKEYARHFDPLHDDAQAMALVKEYPLECCEAIWAEAGRWAPGYRKDNADYNRAIVECVAKMQKAKP